MLRRITIVSGVLLALGLALPAGPRADDFEPIIVRGRPRILPMTGQAAFKTVWYPATKYGIIQVIFDRPVEISSENALIESIHVSDAARAVLVSPVPPAGCAVAIYGTVRKNGYSPIGARLTGETCEPILNGLRAEDVFYRFFGVPSDNGGVMPELVVQVDP